MSEFTTKYKLVDEKPPFNVPLTAHYKLGFAFFTIKDRLPIILTQVIDQLSKDKEEIVQNFGENAREELKGAIGEISKLKYELQTDKDFKAITGSRKDVDLWNEFIVSLKEDNSYFSALWLYAETYMYRRLQNIFENTQTLKNLDYFRKQKEKALTSSYEAMEAVLKVISKFNTADKTIDEVGIFFRQLLKLNLWGNRCDLSMSAGQEIQQNADPFSLLESLDECIVSDHTMDIWNCVREAVGQECVTIEIVNDNSGYEFFTDLCIADYMIEHKLATVIAFNVKAIPWYISDVTPKDFRWTLETLSSHSSPELAEFGHRCSSHLKSGQFCMREVDDFWTSPYEFCRMKELNGNLYDHLSKAHLVMFKGDLNYRKLLADFNWEYTTDFRKALNGFVPTNLCSLRTVKADLICGLSEGLAEKLTAKDSRWMEKGEYGTIQFTSK